MTQIFDELRFAIKCGGSAKKIQQSPKQPRHQDLPANSQDIGRASSLRSNSAGNLRHQIANDEDNDQYERRINTKDRYMKDRLVALNEREAALEAHNALITTHVIPHKNYHQSRYSSKKQGTYSSSKGPNIKHKKSRTHGNEIKYDPAEDTDYILMRPITSSNRSLHRSGGLEPEYFYEKAFNEQHEQQVNFDRYLSKSQIFKAQERSNRQL